MTLNPLFPSDATLGINTDLYELTMAAAYFQGGHKDQIASFELFTRELPEARSFLIAAGLEQALHYVLNVGFSDDQIDYLRDLETFQEVDQRFFDYLREFRFTGDLWALPEGTIFFEHEPILQVRAPIIEAQVLETYLISSINVQSMVAAKAARMVLAAGGRAVVDFGSRRAHGPQAGVLAARAAYIGGCSGTSNVLAGFELGLPVFGTMAHSFVQLFDSETDAFRCFQEVFPENTVVLIDTYDSIEGLNQALQLGRPFQGVRLDSGDFFRLAPQVRAILDERGLRDVQIFGSGNLNEEKLLVMSLQDLPLDAYGVGTDLVVSADAPTCDLVYKLVEVQYDDETEPKFKASEEKETFPYRKQIHRVLGETSFVRDLVTGINEEAPTGVVAEPLLHQYVRAGEHITELPHIDEIRDTASQQLESLPRRYKLLHSREPYPVQFSDHLLESLKRLQARHSRH
jgi:nicotinate phosphoribosyltransferase